MKEREEEIQKLIEELKEVKHESYGVWVKGEVRMVSRQFVVPNPYSSVGGRPGGLAHIDEPFFPEGRAGEDWVGRSIVEDTGMYGSLCKPWDWAATNWTHSSTPNGYKICPRCERIWRRRQSNE